MCPISGSVQFLVVIVTLLLLCHTVIVKSLKMTYKAENATIHMYETAQVNYTISNIPENLNVFECFTENPNIAKIDKNYYIKSDNSISGTIIIKGNFLGKTKTICKLDTEVISENLPVIVIRKERIIDIIFTASVATLVSIIYINFGCALNWSELKQNLKRPFGPVIGLIGQFIIMPLLSFLLGKLLFPNNAEMQLGMFFTGVSPAGGASNIWTVILDGNLDLSITMTTISTLAAFGMMPLWIFTLGKHIFEEGNLVVPYTKILTYAIALIIPLGIGYLISRYLKRTAQFLVRILKGFSGILILFIVIFAIVTNLYLFKLFSWQIIVAGMGLPYLGYILAYIIAKLFKQPDRDCLAISIETSVQNTGIAIFLLRFALPQPEGDLTTVAPVSVAIMTPFPFILIFLYKKIRNRLSTTHKKLDLSRQISMDLGVDSNFNKEDKRIIATIS